MADVIPIEFSLGVMRRMSPVDPVVAAIGGCPYTHVVLRLNYCGGPDGDQSHPGVAFSPVRKSGPERDK